MGCNGSKAVNTELIIRCRERRDLIKAAADHRYHLAAAHVSYFHSLKDVGDSLRRFVDEELVATSSSSPSSLSSPSLILPSDQRKLEADEGGDGAAAKGEGNKPREVSGPSSPVHHDGDACERESHLCLSSDTSDDEHFHSHTTHQTSGHLHIDEDEGQFSPSSPFMHPDLPNGTQEPHVMMNQEVPPQMGFWDPHYNINSQFNSRFRPFYGGNSNTYAHYMNRHAPVMKTVIHEPDTGYSNVHLSSPYQNGQDFFGYSSVHPSDSEMKMNQVKQPSPPAEPPPPPSPKASIWDFVNPFVSIDQEYTSYISHSSHGYMSLGSSPNLNEVRKREGIPDLEEETETEMYMDGPKVKKMNSELKNKREGEGSSGSSQRGGPPVEQSPKITPSRKATMPMSTKPSEGSPISRGSPLEDSDDSTKPQFSGNGECCPSDVTGSIDVSEEMASPVIFVSKSPEDGNLNTKGVTFEADHDSVSSKLSNLNNASAHKTRDLREVIAEIRDDFEVASNYGREVAAMLEVGKMSYHPTFIRVLMSRILHLILPSSSTLPTSVDSKLAKSYFGELDPEINLKPYCLSSTLAKLYEWEKKLYKEVKVEEQLRYVYERQCRKLKVLDERGTEPSKIDIVQASIRKSLTKLNVSIKAIDSISSRIHKLRDEELQPQVAELVNGLIRMWGFMLNCHQKQFQTIMESKVRSLKANTGFHAGSAPRATLQLELQLLGWCNRFNDWICTQKSYVESLNGWLIRCLLYEPEETPEGPVPFSPGRSCAPPIFVICNDWNQAMEAISETQVAMTMHNFASSLQKLRERQDEEQRQRLRAEYLSKDYKRRLKVLRPETETTGWETEDSMVPSESGGSLKVDLGMFRKKLVEERKKHKDTLKLVHDAASSSLQGGLLPIFEALESFTKEAIHAHEKIRLQKSDA